MVDVNEEYTDLTYLISRMDTYYNQVSADGFNGLIESDDLSYQDALLSSRDVLEEEVKSNLMLRTIVDLSTADKSAVLKTTYHYTPTRFILLGCTMAASNIQIGQWLTLNSTKVKESTGKIYLVLKTETLPPFMGSKYRFGIRLYEVNPSVISRQIHEVASQSVNVNYDELTDTLDSLGEKPDVTS